MEFIHNIIDKSVVIPLHLLTASSGVVTNAFNMIIMSKLGLHSSMNVEIFALSAVDFYVAFLELAMFVCFTVRLVYPDSVLDLWGFSNRTLGWMRYPGLFISNWITTLISVEKCISVVAPFHVRLMFTKQRVVVTILIICVAFICIALPMYTVQYFAWSTISSATTNDTLVSREILKIVYTENAAISELVINTTCALSLTFVSQIILILCTVRMVYCLKSSSKVRRHGEVANDKDTYLSVKEKRLVAVAMCLAIVLTVCYVPRYINIAVRYTVSSLYNNEMLNYLVWSLTGVFVSLNYSINFFVYCKLNMKFRLSFFQIICCQR